jgi:hypothetical protein
LNKFHPIRVDYFEKDSHWKDFKDLIRKPVSHCLEISDEALTHLYEQSAGNPYFAKLICRPLFTTMVKLRDCHVTGKEMKEATRLALYGAACNSFQHFWEDGIFEPGARAEEISMNRRRVLLALSEAFRCYEHMTKEHVLGQAKAYSPEVAIEVELRVLNGDRF